jgi:alpha-L-rhamnosidase
MITAKRLRTEYLIDPMGIDILTPRLFWNVSGAKKQTAYHITAKVDGETIWHSGKTSSSRMHARYAGRLLQSRERVDWELTLWDENDQQGEPVRAFFEMGLLKPEDWCAQWISADLDIHKNERYPVDHFRKGFPVLKPVRQARLYITACGLYTAQLNGVRVGEAELAPGYTDYRKRVQYQTYDVTAQLQEGENRFEIALADGWYRGCVGALSHRNVFGKRTKVLAQFEIVYADGSQGTVATDGSFAWSNDGPIRYADMKSGEIVEANRQPSYAGKVRLSEHAVIPSASNNVLVKQHERFVPTLLTSPSGRQILDFGQNLAGFVEFRVQGEKGQTIVLRAAEVLDHGEFTQAPFQCANGKEPIAQKVEFTCSGGEDFYRTQFAIFGFRYVLIEGLAAVDPQDFAAIAVYSSMEQTGSFACSNAWINQLVENTLWSMKGNFADVPTDCPTRERAGWTGDAQIFCTTANYLMDAAPFWRKWLNDLRDRQTKDGKTHSIVPTVGNEFYMQAMDGSVGWADASIFIPYRIYLMVRDRELLRQSYASMKAFAEFSIRRVSKTYPLRWLKKNPYRKYTYDTHQHFGEWLEPEGVEPGNSIVNIILPRPEEATAYFCYQMHCMREAASILGYEDDQQRYADYEAGARKAYNYLFVKDETIDTDRQAKLVRPLALGLLDGEAKENVADRLETALRENDWKIGTGFLSTPFILPVLAAAGKLDAAFKVLENEESPGWLFAPKHGATTIWETWEGFDAEGHPKASHNHYAFGAVCEWLFNAVAGIQVIGENEFLIKPQFGGSLQWTKASYQSVFGEIAVSWKLMDGAFLLNVIIPENCSAVVQLPNGDRSCVESGEYSFEIPG